MYMHKLTKQVVCTYDDPVAETRQGRLRGVKIDSTYIFRGVKYADAKRFHMPEPVQPWEGIREAFQFGHVCCELNTPIPHDQYTVPHYFFPQSEDCQYLNIWTQSLDKTKKRPVMVWMHGGGWFSGSSLEIYSYDGENLSRFGDVVVVSLNHRLNVLGYLDLSRYGEQYKNSVNAGLADLVAALRWIHENIENFGGDPGNVTIFGQSGGGAKVLSMLQTPAADGLFHRAIMQSGGAQGRHAPNHEQARADSQWMAAKIIERLGITPDRIEEIETVDWYDLAQATGEAIWLFSKETGRRAGWAPIYDGEYYFGHPGAYGFREESKHIPMLVGSVYAEFASNYDRPIGDGQKNKWSEEYKLQLYRERFGEKADAVLAAFRKAYPGRNIADVFFTDLNSRKNCGAFLKLRAECGAAPCYNWLFALESPFNGGTLPWHNAEEPYVFYNADYIESAYIPQVSEKLQKIMAGAWVAFAETGDPNHEGMPAWHPVTPDSVPTMVFDRETWEGVDHDAELIDTVPPAPRGGFPGSGIMAAIFGLEPKDR